ncbi:MAG: hypothetical protein NZ821_05495 [Gloeomargarita sp. SKYB31]|nr:hypothetical protein [Gloeomargarita sp. SKYB31]
MHCRLLLLATAFPLSLASGVKGFAGVQFAPTIKGLVTEHIL